MIHPVYLIFYYLILTIAFFEVYRDRKSSKYFAIFFAVYLIFWATIKYNIGADYTTYLKIFFAINKDNLFDYHTLWESDDVEPSFILICKIVGDLGLEFHWVLFFYGFVSIGLKTYMYYNHSPYPFVSLMLYFMPLYFFEDMGQIRQGLSIAITFYSFIFILKRKLVYFLITIFIGYFFHKTAVIFLPAYWIAKLRINTFWAIVAVIISVVIYPLKVYQLLDPIVSLSNIEGVKYGYESYARDNYYGRELDSSIQHEITRILFLIFLFSYDRIGIKNYPNYFFYRNLALMFHMLYYAFRGNAIFAVRLPGAYQPFALIMVAVIIYNSRILYQTVVVSYFFLYSILLQWRFGDGDTFGTNTNIVFNDYNYERLVYEGIP